MQSRLLHRGEGDLGPRGDVNGGLGAVDTLRRGELAKGERGVDDRTLTGGGGAAVVVPWNQLGIRRAAQLEVLPLGATLHHDGVGTAFLLAAGRAEVEVADEVFPVPAEGYAVLPVRAEIRGGGGVVVVDRRHRGLLVVGGPAEERGRLCYIDGCSDTVLVQPVVRGDPCLNLLHLPAGTVQTDHDHPSIRVGLVLSGVGRCVIERDEVTALEAGTAFVLPARVTHRFETGGKPLRIVAWHPDSDVGPTDDDHPMLNRTMRPGTDQRVR